MNRKYDLKENNPILYNISNSYLREVNPHMSGLIKMKIMKGY